MKEKEEVYKLHRSLERKRAELWKLVDASSKAILEKSPAPSKWNTLQILHHVQKSEEATLQYIVKKLSYSPEGLPAATYLSHLKVLLLRFVLWSPIKFKAPKGLDQVPANPDIEGLKQSWQLNFDEFSALIERLSEKELRYQLFKHPIIGRVDMKDTLKFMISHFDHHERQIKRLIG